MDLLTEGAVLPVHLAVASAWLRDDRSTEFAYTSFFSDLRSWLRTHQSLTERQALHTVNTMIGSGDYVPFVRELQRRRDVELQRSRPCALATSGVVHDRHALYSLEGDRKSVV